MPSGVATRSGGGALRSRSSSPPKRSNMRAVTSRQTVVTFEGSRPVFATLASTGRKGRDKEHDHSTPTGAWRVREKHIAATMDGHTHVRSVFRWDGLNTKGKEGIPVFNNDNSGHYKFDEQAFFHVEMNERELIVREYKSEDRWKTAAWTPMSWAVPLA